MSRAAPWIFLRGLMRDQRHWGGFPSEFRRALPDAPVHLIDLPGNGARYRETSPGSVPAMAAWLRTELLLQGLRPPYRVFAMSLGAMVAVAWADSYPTELDACVLANTSLRPVSPFHHRLRPAAWPLLLRLAVTRLDARAAETAILHLTSRHLDASRRVLDDWTAWREAEPVSRANALRQLSAAARFSAPAQAPGTRLLLLNGAGDRLVDPRCSQQLARRWGAALAVHPTAGHDLPLDDAPWVATTVRDWLLAP